MLLGGPQNDVLELWSIFDFLMPGFLGSEQKFNARFRRAVQVCPGLNPLRPAPSALLLYELALKSILNNPPLLLLQVAKTSKKGSRELEQGMLAADSLHKAVMPFVLRRTKDQVLSDLPPKIIQVRQRPVIFPAC